MEDTISNPFSVSADSSLPANAPLFLLSMQTWAQWENTSTSVHTELATGQDTLMLFCFCSDDKKKTPPWYQTPNPCKYVTPYLSWNDDDDNNDNNDNNDDDDDNNPSVLVFEIFEDRAVFIVAVGIYTL